MNIYSLRKAILRDFKRSSGAPLKAGELRELSVEPAISHATADAVEHECSELKSHGFLEAIPGFGGAYLKISRRGLEQLDPEYPQDVFIHGPGAV